MEGEQEVKGAVEILADLEAADMTLRRLLYRFLALHVPGSRLVNDTLQCLLDSDNSSNAAMLSRRL